LRCRDRERLALTDLPRFFSECLAFALRETLLPLLDARFRFLGALSSLSDRLIRSDALRSLSAGAGRSGAGDAAASEPRLFAAGAELALPALGRGIVINGGSRNSSSTGSPSIADEGITRGELADLPDSAAGSFGELSGNGGGFSTGRGGTAGTALAGASDSRAADTPLLRGDRCLLGDRPLPVGLVTLGELLDGSTCGRRTGRRGRLRGLL